MATLHPPFDGLSIGKHDLQASLLGWHTVGWCMVSVNDDYHFSASGNYKALGHSGTFDLSLALTDENHTAPSGPCTLTNAGRTLSGTYNRNGSEISFVAKDHSVTASSDGQNVLLQVKGYPKFRVLA